MSGERSAPTESCSGRSCPLMASAGKDRLPECGDALSWWPASRAQEPVLHHPARGDHRHCGPHGVRYERPFVFPRQQCFLILFFFFFFIVQLFLHYVSSASSCRKVLSGCSSVQAGGAGWRLYYRWRDQYCTDRSGWPAKQDSHHSSRAGALHRDSQVIRAIITPINELCNL